MGGGGGGIDLRACTAGGEGDAPAPPMGSVRPGGLAGLAAPPCDGRATVGMARVGIEAALSAAGACGESTTVGGDGVCAAAGSGGGGRLGRAGFGGGTDARPERGPPLCEAGSSQPPSRSVMLPWSFRGSPGFAGGRCPCFSLVVAGSSLSTSIALSSTSVTSPEPARAPPRPFVPSSGPAMVIHVSRSIGDRAMQTRILDRRSPCACAPTSGPLVGIMGGTTRRSHVTHALASLLLGRCPSPDLDRRMRR
jgi:hypothetical protein